MDSEKRVHNLMKHVEQHPTDYQAVIGLLKANSDAIAHQIKEAQNERMAKLAKAKRAYKKEREENGD